MKKFGVYLLTVLIITIFLPGVIVKTFNIVPRNNTVVGEGFIDTKDVEVKEEEKRPELDTDVLVELVELDTINVYNPQTKKIEEMDLEAYIKGVVAAEMPAAFELEALKAQAVAARTYAVNRSIRFKDGHPDHKSAPICTDVHCQAYLSLDQLRSIHGDSWIENYWGKIESAVEITKGQLIYYDGKVAEPLYHSTSGGMTEDAINVFATDTPYLKSVTSPYEDEAPKFKTVTTMTVEEFINKIKTKYKKVNLNKEDFYEKIKLIEKTNSGRIKKIVIDNEILDGRNIRDLFGLNSTNFSIMFDKTLGIIDIVTYGYGHGVGMSQWGANGMAENGSDYVQILKHYYTDVIIK